MECAVTDIASLEYRGRWHNNAYAVAVYGDGRAILRTSKAESNRQPKGVYR